jgi:hypothetical protein
MVFVAIVAALSLGQKSAAPPDFLERAARIFNGDAPKDDLLMRFSKVEAQRDFQPILDSEKPETSAHIVAAFALAMKGIHMDENLARILAPLKKTEGQLESIPASGGLAKDEILPEDIPTAVYTLYKARHDLSALKSLLTAPIDGAVAENRDDDVMDAMSRNPVDLMRLGAQDEAVYARLWDILDWNIGPMRDRLALIRRLKAGRWPNQQIRHTALRLASDLRKPKHRISQKPVD